jgi:hypothetical protein
MPVQDTCIHIPRRTPHGQGEITQSELPSAGSIFTANDGETNASGRLLSVQSQIVISPFAVEGPCILRVCVETEAGELKGQGLGVQLATPT